MAATCKLAKYSALGAQYDFQPVAVETLGPLNESACEFLNNLGRKIGDNTGYDRSTSFLFQRISVLTQRFNAVWLKFLYFFTPPSGIFNRGFKK